MEAVSPQKTWWENNRYLKNKTMQRLQCKVWWGESRVRGGNAYDVIVHDCIWLFVQKISPLCVTSRIGLNKDKDGINGETN